MPNSSRYPSRLENARRHYVSSGGSVDDEDRGRHSNEKSHVRHENLYIDTPGLVVRHLLLLLR